MSLLDHPQSIHILDKFLLKCYLFSCSSNIDVLTREPSEAMQQCAVPHLDQLAVDVNLKSWQLRENQTSEELRWLSLKLRDSQNNIIFQPLSEAFCGHTAGTVVYGVSSQYSVAKKISPRLKFTSDCLLLAEITDNQELTQ